MSARSLVAVCLLVALAGCEAKGASPAGPGGFPPALVTAATVESETLPIYRDAIGRCVATEVVSVQPQVSGTITSIGFKDGAELKKGDLLFTIDARPYQAQLDLAEANLAQNKAQLDLGKTEYDRMATLLRTNAVSRQEYDARKNAVQVAEAQLQSSLAQVSAAKLNVEFCTIRAPIDGRAGQRLVDLGNVVLANAGTPLLVIQRQDPIYADFTVSERDLASVRKSLAEGTLHAHVTVPGPDGVSREGAVTFLDNAVQDATGTVKLRALVANSDRAFWPGQFVEVRLVLREAPALVLPTSAIQVGQHGNFVYVMGADASVAIRPVEVGQRHGDRVVVTRGLEGGEKVVATGQLMLFPGAKVQVAPVGSGAH